MSKSSIYWNLIRENGAISRPAAPTEFQSEEPMTLQTLKLFTFDQFSAQHVPIIYPLPTLPALEEVMENFAELMQRLLEIQSSGRQRSLELIAEDERLMDGLQKRNLAGKPTQTVKFSLDGPERA